MNIRDKIAHALPNHYDGYAVADYVMVVLQAEPIMDIAGNLAPDGIFYWGNPYPDKYPDFQVGPGVYALVLLPEKDQ